jgi:CheY-like chemotaxis protein
MNLLGNSLKYTPDGYIAVSMRSYVNQADPSKVDVTMLFEDSGKGMSLEYQRTRLFSPFSQADPFSDGLGLGLSIVRQIVDSLGGHIDIRSEVGVGTTAKVHLTLPLTEAPVTDDLDNIRQVTAGKRLVVVCPTSVSKKLAFCGKALQVNSDEWFHMDFLSLPSGADLRNIEADAILCPEAELNLNSTIRETRGIPLIITCPNQSNQLNLRKRLMDLLPPERLQGVQIVAQPLGPYKMGPVYKTVFSSCFSQLPRLDVMPDPHHMDTGMQQAVHTLQVLPIDATKTDISTGNSPVHPTAVPTQQNAPRPKLARPLPLRLQSGLAPDTSSSTQHHVLLVDDNAINLKLLTLFMTKIGLAFAKASDGLQALEEYRKNSCLQDLSIPVSRKQVDLESIAESEDGTPPLSRSQSASNESVSSSAASAATTPMDARPFTWVLMDLSMPVMDGLESTRRIRAFEREHKLKKAVVVALTGLASADAQQDALDAGVDFYLAKPVRFADLKKLMEV